MPLIQYERKRLSHETLAVIATANEIIAAYQAQGFALTLRQLYYQFVARGIIPNTERSYEKLGGITSAGRRAGLIDWEAIEDRTRYLRKLSSWGSPVDILRSAKDSYHRDLWATQDYRVEVWIEKDALVGVIEKVCNDEDVPFFSCRGYVSDSEMWRAGIRAHNYSKKGKKTLFLHLGDHDPSGIDMTRDITDRIELFSGFAQGVEISRIALTMEQVNEVNPPPNPAKIADSRFNGYVAEYGESSWELDALEPQYIVNLIRQQIELVRDPVRWQDAIDEQEEERDQIEGIIERWDDIKDG